MSFFDTHAHLDLEEFDGDLPAVVERSRQAGVDEILCVGISLQSSLAAIDLAEQYSGIYPAVGIHPNSADEAGAEDWQAIETLAAKPSVKAVGETGLDRFREYTPFALQVEYFQRHLELSQSRNLPIVIHCREAADELMPLLRQAASKAPLKGILHAFSGDAEMARECVALGLYVSFAGNVTYTNKKFRLLREAALAVPDDRLLVETDSPYLTPEPLRGKQKRNEPANVAHTARFLAQLRGLEPSELERQTTANARRLLGIY
ncbi:MAG: TatD family hydrolase [Thermoguttaceae bacterium]